MSTTQMPLIYSVKIMMIILNLLLQTTKHINQDLACKTKPSELFGCFDPGSSKEYSQCDIFNDTGILPRSNDE